MFLKSFRELLINIAVGSFWAGTFSLVPTVILVIVPLSSFEPEFAIDDLKPAPILKTCIPPCKGESNCMRICNRFADKANYPDISAENLKTL